MKEVILTLEKSRPLTADTYELTLSGDASAITAPGQFVNLALPGRFLRRPISACAWGPDGLLLIVKAVGGGTRELVSSPAGTAFPTLTGLGNGFDLNGGGERPLLIGGGVGVAPLYGLAKWMVKQGRRPAVVLGFRSKADAFYVEEFASLGCDVFIATEDGSLGAKGFVTDCVARALPEADYAFACGPTPMLKAVYALPRLKDGQFSLEARMGCGFGACVGCTMQTKNGPRRVCKDGPVFRKEELAW